MIKKILRASRSLVVFTELTRLPPWSLLKELMVGLLEESWSSSRLVEGYYSFLEAFLTYNYDLDNHSWQEWILEALLHTENRFTLWAENEEGPVPQPMAVAVAHDINCIKTMANIPWKDLINAIEGRIDDGQLLNFFPGEEDRSFDEICADKGLKTLDIDSLAEYYRHKGSGNFSRYKGFYWNGNFLEGINETDPITLDQLIGYDIQKQILLENTEKFIKGYPANNILLYGDKGTGKSSMVKGLIHKYWDAGLRIIELPKIHLADYHTILNLVEGRCFRFILYIDDLSFEDHEVEYKHIKALLEGGLKVRPSNTLVYATSNRRHIVKEVVSDRSSIGYKYNERNEISPTDSMQEKLSLADRFGITLTFISPNQKGYLEMVESIARERGLDIEKEILFEEALKWEKRYNGRSGRSARQFIDSIEGTEFDV